MSASASHVYVHARTPSIQKVHVHEGLTIGLAASFTVVEIPIPAATSPHHDLATKESRLKMAFKCISESPCADNNSRLHIMSLDMHLKGHSTFHMHVSIKDILCSTLALGMLMRQHPAF